MRPTTFRLPTEAELKARARELTDTMARVGRVVYALPLATTRAELEDALRASGFVLREVDAEAKVGRWTDERGDDSWVVVEREDLGVRIFEARGPGAVARVQRLLDRVPFVPQSRLLAEALDVASPDARKALVILAHCVVAWDDEWGDLFLLHLASPDPIARHDAVSALFLAAMCANAPAPAIGLLREAHRRERFPKLRDTLADAIARLGG